jgi:hypothetical protein
MPVHVGEEAVEAVVADSELLLVDASWCKLPVWMSWPVVGAAGFGERKFHSTRTRRFEVAQSVLRLSL